MKVYRPLGTHKVSEAAPGEYNRAAVSTFCILYNNPTLHAKTASVLTYAFVCIFNTFIAKQLIPVVIDVIFTPEDQQYFQTEELLRQQAISWIDVDLLRLLFSVVCS